VSADGVSQQNPDGSWSEARPLGWQGRAIDFEVYVTEGGFKANGYDEDLLIEVVAAKTRRGLDKAMKKAAKRHDMPWAVLG
jgi:hypothetical protein